MNARPTEMIAREVFDQVAVLPSGSAERAAILRSLREHQPAAYHEVLSLLESSDTTHALLDNNAGAAAAQGGVLRALSAQDESLTEVGAYRILRKLGSGGMGVVYEAQQESPRRSVALKLIRPDVISPSLLRRFELEAEALGMLHHPGIAQIHEAGRAIVAGSERMFIAMELVEGPTLSQFVRDVQPDSHARLELLAKIADAVDHAHHRGVVHRDLKPGNIIIDKASNQPKVLDFGVARLALEGPEARTMHTRDGQIVGTLEYMSPEQLSGDPRRIDARTDVYALGVMLYELLSGDVPINLAGKDLFSAIDHVRRHEPKRLSRVLEVRAQSSGKKQSPKTRWFWRSDELDDIVGMALEKDPARRYQSAAAMSDDLRRYLRHEPVIAHAQTTWYQARKFAQRHRTLVGAVAAVIVALTAGLFAALWQANRAERAQQQVAAQLREVERLSALESVARTKAEQDSTTMQAVANYLITLLENAAPEYSGGREMTVREALDKASGNVEEEFKDQPVVLMRLNDVIRQTYGSLGDADKSEKYGRRALELAKTIWADDPAKWGDEAGDLSVALMELDKNDEAEALLRPALAEVIAKVGEDHEVVAELRMHLGSVLRRLEKQEESETLLRQALASREAMLGMEDRRTMVALNELSLSLREQGRLEEAEQMARRNRDTTIKHFGADHPDAIAANTNLSNLLDALGRDDEAIMLLKETLERSGRVMGANHPNTLMVALALGTTQIDSKRPEDAIATLQPTRAAMEQVFGLEHNNTLNLLNNLSVAYERAGRLDDASRTLETLREVMLRKEPESMRTVVTLGNSARVEMNRKQTAFAVNLAQQALDSGVKALPEGHPMRHRLVIGYATALIMDGQVEKALPLAQTAYEALASAQGPASNPAKNAAKTIADKLLAKGENDKAAIWSERANAQ